MLRRTILRSFAPTAVLMAEKGVVASWIASRGFGFIEDAKDKKQHFVHHSAIKVEEGGFRALTTGQEVEFDITTQDGRTRAENVTAPGGAPLPSGPRPAMDGGRGGGFRGGRGGGRGGGFRGGRGGRGGYDRNNNNNQGGQQGGHDDF